MQIELLFPDGRRLETVMNKLPEPGERIELRDGEFVIAEVTHVVKDNVVYFTAKLDRPSP